MTIGILGKKLGMTQLFQADGSCVPVTVLQAGPCVVLQVKVPDVGQLPEEHRLAEASRGKKRGKVGRRRQADGYYAVQLGFDDKRPKSSTKAETGHAARAGSTPRRFVRELRFAEMPPYKRGDTVSVDVLKDVERVDVTGVTKGRGFSGTIKRWGFSRQATTHGNSKHHRKPGGIGRWGSTSKGVPKGKKMCGHYGTERVTVQNLAVVKIDEERNLVFLRGAVPGHRSGYLVLRKSVKVGSS
jgi:large subunit ribosomal protein L3